jgi:hypothetical protein
MSNKLWAQILLPTTDEAYSNSFGLAQDDTAANFVVTGAFTGAEKATLQQYNPADETWTDVVFQGNNYFLDSTTNTLGVWQDWGTYRFHKEATATAVGIVMQSANAGNSGGN